MHETQHLVIIGNGIAGITLAQQVRLTSKCAISIISDESRTHFSRPALMYVYMGHMRRQDIIPYADWYYEEQQLNTIHDKVLAVDFENKTLQLEKGNPITYDVLVFATGSSLAYYNWPGLNSKGVQGLVTLQDLELMEQQTAGIKQAVVVGGGLIGIEMAEMLRSRNIEVTMLVRENLFWKKNLPIEEARLVTKHINDHNINLLLQEELVEIVPDETNHVKAVKLKSGYELPCQFVGIATGVKPNISFVNNPEIETDKGFLIDRYFKTNIQDVYAIGDCAQFKIPEPDSPAIEQLWYTARQHGEALANNLNGNPAPYIRGPWFNSAKFFDIEYQTYGYVPANLENNEYRSIYWEHPDKLRAIRILFNMETEKLMGINLLGVRYRHDMCHYWLKNEYTIHQVIEEIKSANFDTEFFKRFEPELLKAYRIIYPQKVIKEKSNWWKLRERYNLFSTKSEEC
jgi:NADPH-dependent 2,4-dienoyl-CoA reductase/sulfur reductase-like enzyme